uniref:Uncharacterized protein n=1 Tax=Romanomermis culicivorax TaxID=13658 RepID=A0A915K0X1_ROMCU
MTGSGGLVCMVNSSRRVSGVIFLTGSGSKMTPPASTTLSAASSKLPFGTADGVTFWTVSEREMTPGSLSIGLTVTVKSPLTRLFCLVFLRDIENDSLALRRAAFLRSFHVVDHVATNAKQWPFRSTSKRQRRRTLKIFYSKTKFSTLTRGKCFNSDPNWKVNASRELTPNVIRADTDLASNRKPIQLDITDSKINEQRCLSNGNIFKSMTHGALTRIR